MCIRDSLGIIMCLGMALSVHAEGSGQFFQFDGEKWNKEEFSWTDSQGQIWYAHEYGTNGEAIISAVTEAVMELQVPSYVYKDGAVSYTHLDVYKRQALMLL